MAILHRKKRHLFKCCRLINNIMHASWHIQELGFSTDKSDQRNETLGKNNKFAKCDVIQS